MKRHCCKFVCGRWARRPGAGRAGITDQRGSLSRVGLPQKGTRGGSGERWERAPPGGSGGHIGNGRRRASR